MKKIKVGMIGVGRITDLHYPAYAGYDKAELAYICAATEEECERRKKQWKVPKATTNYKDVLADPEIDMVEICTPHHLHRTMAVEAAAAGKHIQLQKPMGLNVKECLEIIDAAKRAGVKLKVLENFVFYPPYRKAKSLIDEGEIGEVVSMRIKLGAGGMGGWYVPLDTWIWRLSETEKGGGPVIYDDGYHKFSVGIMFGGEVESVFAWIDRSFGLIDSPAIVTWKSKSGVTGCIDATFSPNLNVRSKYYAADERVEITGTKGTIWVTRCTGQLLDEPSVILYKDGRKICFEDVKTDWVESFKDSTRHFIDCIANGGEPYLTGEQALEVQRFSLAAIKSSKEGRQIDPATLTE